MLRPQVNEQRQVMDLGGFWTFRTEPSAQGVPIAVPASWNDQLPELRDYLGPAWYETRFTLPRAWKGGRILLRFDSVVYFAEVWLNGERLGEHEGGHLPFGFDVTAHARPGENVLVVRVDGSLAPDRVPPGAVPRDPRDAFVASPNYPDASYDFFPFCGIHRPVRLCLVPPEGIEDVRVTTGLEAGAGIVRVTVRTAAAPGATAPASTAAAPGATAHLRLVGNGADIAADAPIAGGACIAEVRVPGVRPWCPEDPALYRLTVTLRAGHQDIDSYELPVGVRTVEVRGDSILLNGKPVYLKGFGRHEDFPVTGRGLVPAVIIRDAALMKWTGANSFRTTHYPYSEEMMDIADRLGFLVIDETPAVGLFFGAPGLERRAVLCRAFVQGLVERDANRPCVIAWCLANEPHSRRPEAAPFFRKLYDLAHRLDGTRPVTIVSHVGADEESFAFCDFLSYNCYYGWYSEAGRIEEGTRRMEREIDEMHAKFGKPFILTEFGTDAITGTHSEPPEMFTEEYQARFIECYLAALAKRPWVVGAHVWNLCDFKTGQAVHRPAGLNHKGVFTRDRRPKLAAHVLRQAWGGR